MKTFGHIDYHYQPALYVNYAHSAEPKGVRYIQMAKDKVPGWACDVQQGDGNPRNFVGQVVHPSDQYIPDHILDHANQAETLEFMDELRSLWECLTERAGHQDDLERILNMVTRRV